MAKIGRNTPCPCGSGKKYKRCCQLKDEEMRQSSLPPGQFQYESGSYGSPDRGYMPSIFCYKEVRPNSWEEHFCLTKPDEILDDEDAASAIAESDLSAGHSLTANGGSQQDFALSLRHKGYKSVSDYKVVSK